MQRKVIQMATSVSRIGDVEISTLVVLCDDGALLQFSPRHNPPWLKFPELPSRDDYSLAEVPTVLNSPNGEERYP